MSDQPNCNRPLSEISHLFLSNIRDAAGNGLPRPQRTPPKPDVGVDLTSEEYAQMCGDETAPEANPAPVESERIAPLTVVDVKQRAIDASSATSQCTAMALRPCAEISSTVWARPASLMSATATSAP